MGYKKYSQLTKKFEKEYKDELKYHTAEEKKLLEPKALASFMDTSGKPFISLMNDGTIQVDEKFTTNEISAKFWDTLLQFIPDSEDIKAKVALTYCYAAMKAIENGLPATKALWSEALHKARKCFE